MRFKQLCAPLLLILLTAALLFFSVPQGSAFGSEIDWLSQHVAAAEHFRQSVYENGSLLIDYSDLGAGSNFYMFAYYGYLRPDILIGCLLPMLSMKTILIAYAILGVFASVLLCWLWLHKNGFSAFFCFVGGALMACAACLFHAHRQLMFVNYLPWLFLALIAIDFFLRRGRIVPFILCALMFILHSFYFSVSCFAVCLLYLLYRRRERRTILWFLLGCAVAVALAAILLLPTGLVLLEQAKDNGGGNSLWEILAVNPTLRSLLYSPYGCGLTLVSLYGLLLGIRHRPTRWLSVALLAAVFWNLIPFVLNGGLYVRAKVLIPFIPLILLVCVTVLSALYQNKLRHSLPLLLLSFVPLAVAAAIGTWARLYALDAACLLLFVLLTWRGKRQLLPYLSLLLVPPLLFVQSSRTDSFVPADDNRQNLFTEAEIEAVYQDKNARFDQFDTDEAIANVNYSAVPGMKKTSMYSSTMNAAYSTFFYDVMKNPISINNRVALNAAPNPFFQYLMGVRYLQAEEELLPAGYEIRQERDGQVLAENEDVLPLAYASTALMSEEEFSSLSFPETLDALTSHTVVDTAAESGFSSQIRAVSLDYQVESVPDTLSASQIPGGYALTVSKQTTVTLTLDEPVQPGQVLILGLSVENPDGRAVIITCNGIKNKLASDSAAYPNENRRFTWYLSSNEPIETITLTFSRGSYELTGADSWLAEGIVENETVTPLSFAETQGSEVLSGSIQTEQDGYFVTSLPIQNGYRAFVDGQEVAIETVNCAFVGFPLSAGEHEIVIVFTPPGRAAGMIVSIAGLAALLFLIFWEQRRRGGPGHSLPSGRASS